MEVNVRRGDMNEVLKNSEYRLKIAWVVVVVCFLKVCLKTVLQSHQELHSIDSLQNGEKMTYDREFSSLWSGNTTGWPWRRTNKENQDWRKW